MFFFGLGFGLRLFYAVGCGSWGGGERVGGAFIDDCKKCVDLFKYIPFLLYLLQE
jgi:hypothetical protein